MRNVPKQGEVDVVYLWCDPTDPRYISARENYAKEYNISTFRSPTRDHNEIYYSVISVRKYMKRVRNIYICSPFGQQVKDLDSEKYGVTYVSNEAILGEENCPNFNSHALELFTCMIEGLSEWYIQMNDDLFIGSEVSLETFYDFKDKKINYYYENHIVYGSSLSTTTKEVIYNESNENYHFWPCHSPKMFCKSDVIHLIHKYLDWCNYTKKTKFRSRYDFKLIHIYGYYLTSRELGNFIFLKNIIRNNSMNKLIKLLRSKLISNGLYNTLFNIYLEYFYKKKMLSRKSISNEKIYALLQVSNSNEYNKRIIDDLYDNKPIFICLNDSYSSGETKKSDIQSTYNYFYKKFYNA